MAVTVRPPEGHDWTYEAARQRLLRAGRAQLPRHAAAARMDDNGNRIVECRCGWSGNGLGWTRHLDSVVRGALDSVAPGG